MDTLEWILELVEGERVGKIGICGDGVKGLGHEEGSIADHYKIEHEDEQGRNPQEGVIWLFARLKKEKNFLLILDDIWEKIHLDELGIPHREVHKGFKVISTTRSLDGCRGMKTDKDIIVEVLSDEKSWTLFCQNVGDMIDLDRVGDLARVNCC
ncbi:disease resistance protein At4g27190-like [Magnolia sinica]|uniref:disease resistance protein At4g27190-like n=1 Tax=Magnolia sinica TaxID=86752 RepID=UPI0026583492|nr:disease resistance protein At4g27190-like [Magnolia sinica]